MQPRCGVAGHGELLTVRAHEHLHVVIATGPVDARSAAQRLEVARSVLHADHLVAPQAGRRG